MVRDLVEIAVEMVREERAAEVREKARRRAEERVLDLLLPPLPRGGRVRRAGGVDPRAGAAHAREAARAAARRPARSQAASRSTSARSRFPSFEIIAGSSVEEVDINVKDMLPGLFQGRTKKRKLRGARGARGARAGRRAEADRHGERRARRGRARRSRPASSSSTRSTRSPAARAATGPTSAAKACSATSCRSSRARR